MAKHIYYIRKHPDCKQSGDDWVQLDGKKFYALVNSQEGEGRYFADMGDFTIEMTKTQYAGWLAEKNREDYIRERDADISIVSIHDDLWGDYGHGDEIIPDDTVNVEDTALNRVEISELRAALNALDQESRFVITELYLIPETKTEQELAVELGMTQQGVHKRKKKILEILKNLVVKSKNFQQ